MNIKKECLRNEKINIVRNEAKVGLDKQADKKIVVGRTGIVRVPDVDRDRLAQRNVLDIVLSIIDSGLYLLGM